MYPETVLVVRIPRYHQLDMYLFDVFAADSYFHTPLMYYELKFCMVVYPKMCL
jgi:hypothetical protein